VRLAATSGSSTVSTGMSGSLCTRRQCLIQRIIMGKYFWLGLVLMLLIVTLNYILVDKISGWFALLLIPEAPISLKLGSWCAEKDNVND